MPEFTLGHRVIRSGGRPFVIAEAGVNYENDMSVAKRMIEEAARAQADAIKFQTYKAEKLAAAASPTYWAESKTQREFFMQYDRFGEAEYRELAATCEANGILFLSTPFDEEAVDFLDPYVPAFKVASADITNLGLLRHIARRGKPVLLSTGASTLSEIARAVELLEREGAGPIALLHCILHYPTEPEEANLLSIPYLQEAFPDCVVGYSDHTKPDAAMVIPTAAALLGAAVIEKHFTLDKSLPGNDHYHAMDPEDLALLIQNCRLAWSALGTKQRRLLPGEREARKYARRSLVAETPIARGERITLDHLTAKRPGTGIPAEQLDAVLGRVATVDIAPDTILDWSMLEGESPRPGGASPNSPKAPPQGRRW